MSPDTIKIIYIFLTEAFFKKFTRTWFAGMRVFQGLLGTTKTTTDLSSSMSPGQSRLESISTGIVMLLGIILTYIYIYISSAKMSLTLNVVEFLMVMARILNILFLAFALFTSF